MAPRWCWGHTLIPVTGAAGSTASDFVARPRARPVSQRRCLRPHTQRPGRERWRRRPGTWASRRPRLARDPSSTRPPLPRSWVGARMGPGGVCSPPRPQLPGAPGCILGIKAAGGRGREGREKITLPTQEDHSNSCGCGQKSHAHTRACHMCARVYPQPREKTIKAPRRKHAGSVECHA